MSTNPLSQISIWEGSLILVNREHAVRESTPGSLVPVGGQPGILLCSQAAAQLEALMAELGGWRDIVPVSGWRSFEEQQSIWDDTLAESGPEFTQKYVALPGHSEHQTGLAIDLALRQDSIDFICPEFPYSGICQEFRNRAAHFGFIERYPAGKESITGIGHEPWHFRYVGTPHANIMTKNHLTLEEYIAFTKQFPHGRNSYTTRVCRSAASVSYCPANTKSVQIPKLDTQKPYHISGNNVDGYIITEWR